MPFGQRLREALRTFVSNRLSLFVIALLVPEYILAWAIRQYLQARQIAKVRHASRWTITHGFFLIMGGFHLFESPLHGPCNDNGQLSSPIAWPVDAPLGSRRPKPNLGPHENDKPIRMLTGRDLFYESTDLQFVVPTEEEIKDRGKSDWFAKSLVVIQTTWFLTQYIARQINQLPIAKLETVTAAYAVMNLAIYFFWWDKPLNEMWGAPSESLGLVWGWSDPPPPPKLWSMVHRVMTVIVGSHDNSYDSGGLKGAPMFWSGCPGSQVCDRAVRITLVLGTLFGAIHCIGWSFTFPSHADVVLWRISCALMVAVPLYISISGWILWSALDRLPFLKDSKWFLWLVPFIILGAVLYISARVVTLTLAFTTLRSLPPAAYETVQWTTFIPHI
ncbi:hypothetical protein C8F04DRAFT_1112503 [Mycena alexandri]|uniref:Uncharacterized protein n=1 Tax=Mycena alexandri TaxID=1745969 RepID=A0AAD6SS36_9AGAR|nr:hypothetical protein C8F04DRAFT_1112503 [Mycena alexandri]